MEVKKTLKCKFCGNNHEIKKDLCPAWGQKCKKCQGSNHFYKMCKKDEEKNYDAKRNKRRVAKKVQKQSDSGTDSDDSSAYVSVSVIKDNSAKGGYVMAILNMKFNDGYHKVSCLVDTGANVCVIGYNNYNILLGKDSELKKSTFKLSCLDGSQLKVLGQTDIVCKHKKLKYKIQFQVIDLIHGPLLSARACSALGLVKFCNTIGASISKETDVLKKKAGEIIKEFKEVFQGYGRLEGEVHLEIDQSIRPTIQKARRIPVAFKKNLKEGLHMLEASDIICKEDSHTEWVSNILLVKRQKSLRICLDPIPLNKSLKRPNRQCTTLDEILPELSKAKIFSTVDEGFW